MSYMPQGTSTGRRSKLPTAFLAGLVIGTGIAALAIPSRTHGSTAASQAPSEAAQGPSTGGPGSASGSAGSAGSESQAQGGGPTAPAQAAGAATSGSAAGAGTAAETSGSGGTTTGSARAGTVSNASPPNGGATFRGVTAKSITLGFVNLDSSTLASVCPRCGNGDGANGAAANALVAAWRKDGMLPVNGRDFNIVNVKYNILSSEEIQAACEQMAQQVHPFLVGGVNMQASSLGSMDPCLAQQNHLLTVDGETSGDQTYLNHVAPLAWQIQPTVDTVWANYALFLQKVNLLQGQVLCMYSADDSVQAGIQEDLSSTLRAELHKLGYGLKVDITYGSTPNDGVAVTQFRTQGCTVALIIGTLTEPSGFQNVAQQQGYHPKYPIAETANEMTDAVADITYNATAEDGNFGMKTQFWNWSSRSPAAPLNNARATYCVNAYQAYEHRTVDVYNNDAELHYLFEICSILEVVRQAILTAGPDLTQNSFVSGMEAIHGMATTYEPSVTYGPAKQAGADEFAQFQFKASRWQPSNDYWGAAGPWTPYYLGTFGS